MSLSPSTRRGQVESRVDGQLDVHMTWNSSLSGGLGSTKAHFSSAHADIDNGPLLSSSWVQGMTRATPPTDEYTGSTILWHRYTAHKIYPVGTHRQLYNIQLNIQCRVDLRDPEQLSTSYIYANRSSPIPLRAKDFDSTGMSAFLLRPPSTHHRSRQDLTSHHGRTRISVSIHIWK